MRGVPHVCVLVVCLAGCGDAARTRILPEIAAEEGIEVATLKALPTPLDESWLWSLRSVRQVRTAHAADQEPLLYQPRAVLELRDGLLLVHDPMASRVFVILDLSADTAVNRFGRSGEGPGELSGDIALSESLDGEIVVADRGNLQLHRYARSGEWLGSQRLEFQGWPLAGGFQRGPGLGRFVALLLNQEDQSRWNELAEIDLGSTTSRAFLRFPDFPPEAGPGTIHRGRQLWTVLEDHVIAMWSGDPTVTVFDSSGRIERRIILPLSTSRLTTSDIEREVARVGSIARQLEPGPRPMTNMLYAVNDSVFGMFVSALWHAAEDPPLPSGKIYWRLFTVRGEYLGVAEQPEDFRLLGRGQNTLWANLLDEAGYPVVAELELVRMDREE